MTKKEIAAYNKGIDEAARLRIQELTELKEQLIETTKENDMLRRKITMCKTYAQAMNVTSDALTHLLL